VKRRLGDRAAELAVCFVLLSRLPVPYPRGKVDFARAVWAYPVVGACLGALGGALFWGLCRIGQPPALAACWTLAASVLLTGGLHEDGLADTADGFGGGRDAARKLEIMRDSRIGSFGTIALVLSLAIRGAAVAAFPAPSRAAVALVVAGCLGRAAIVAVLATTRPARNDGLGASLADIPPPSVIAAGAVAVLAALLLPTRPAGLALLMAGLAALAMAVLARRQIGGHTGDVLGATAVLAECAVLASLAGRP
jgi:adenosylcobinamide-GDP ribazoletransferase